MSEPDAPRTPVAVGQRYLLSWRDYAECEIIELPYGGNVVEFRFVESGEVSCLSRNDWENWMGNTTPIGR